MYASLNRFRKSRAERELAASATVARRQVSQPGRGRPGLRLKCRVRLAEAPSPICARPAITRPSYLTETLFSTVYDTFNTPASARPRLTTHPTRLSARPTFSAASASPELLSNVTPVSRPSSPLSPAAQGRRRGVVIVRNLVLTVVVVLLCSDHTRDPW